MRNSKHPEKLICEIDCSPEGYSERPETKEERAHRLREEREGRKRYILKLIRKKMPTIRIDAYSHALEMIRDQGTNLQRNDLHYDIVVTMAGEELIERCTLAFTAWSGMVFESGNGPGGWIIKRNRSAKVQPVFVHREHLSDHKVQQLPRSEEPAIDPCSEKS